MSQSRRVQWFPYGSCKLKTRKSPFHLKFISSNILQTIYLKFSESILFSSKKKYIYQLTKKIITDSSDLFQNGHFLFRKKVKLKNIYKYKFLIYYDN